MRTQMFLTQRVPIVKNVAFSSEAGPSIRQHVHDMFGCRHGLSTIATANSLESPGNFKQKHDKMSKNVRKLSTSRPKIVPSRCEDTLLTLFFSIFCLCAQCFYLVTPKYCKTQEIPTDCFTKCTVLQNCFAILTTTASEGGTNHIKIPICQHSLMFNQDDGKGGLSLRGVAVTTKSATTAETAKPSKPSRLPLGTVFCRTSKRSARCFPEPPKPSKPPKPS